MAEIDKAVGQNGENLEPDVLTVQGLLNRHDLTPLSALQEDGRCGPETIKAIRHFQVRSLGIQGPDGRVDPGGRTLRALNVGATDRGSGENTETRQVDREMRASRVDPRVKETAVTTRIIDALVPRFGPVRARIIGGYLSDSDQFWKVNYHWEYLLTMVQHSISLPLDDRDSRDLVNIRSNLLSCKPDPDSGYTTGSVGKPEDRSGYEAAGARYKVLASMKDQFVAITNRAGLKSKSPRSPTMFDLAGARVAAPGTSNHGTGYAVDIEGDNAAIKSLCKSLGATLAFDEKSHVHVEFKNGVSG
jgi:peptidoglycan hydrolase-like protein with peptidoglycan-binding domain